jgi:hypothetical protein
MPRCRREIMYANIMIFLGQFTGVNAIMYYMSVLMNQIGFDAANSKYMSLVGGGAFLFGTIPAIFLMETCGHRFWDITMLPGFSISLLTISVGYTVPLSNLAAAEGVYLTGLIIYMGFFGSYACLTWAIPSEVYPTYLWRWHDHLGCYPLFVQLHCDIQLYRKGVRCDAYWPNPRFLRRHRSCRLVLPDPLHARNQG